MGKVPPFLVIIVVIIAVAASYRFVQQRRERAENRAAPQLETRVEVSNKREKVLNDRRSRQQMTTPAGSTVRYEASFRPLSGGAAMTFRLSEAQYHRLTVGDRGTLSYRGSQFVNFAGE
ncbi:TPA: DUF2500 domain-containing protein [Pluralibacter gergoviae]|uniref:DUF2500 domain-containing protein n=1 Tax=Pluralibacter gergoviae TaxID=61647 RepID=A0A0F0VN54_PLUGE|nr:DUF2500 domain-containing protein [Pluralibacter gergoviae]EKV6248720.1 DUF2500 domain-containing protein [Pluralibacter gergoviae]EKW9967554.1 DUF2500 domain-containing protein [Pluralibacter gergoviae]ELD4303332.1 DUF2500 domain-containing protein [Pluralibacter gergoviae]ELG9931117.1 DUF2500 domain-containing protein [Pluralibacter gergoviae]ELK5594737.1 DUF2500 domain-containing protein [Pluralibacter gergoviae]